MKILVYIEGFKIYLKEKEFRKMLKEWGYSKQEIDAEIESSRKENCVIEDDPIDY